MTTQTSDRTHKALGWVVLNLGRTRYEMRCTCGERLPWDQRDGEAHRTHLAEVLAVRERSQLADAWGEGFKQGGPMHDVDYDDPDAHTRNPYRT